MERFTWLCLLLLLIFAFKTSVILSRDNPLPTITLKNEKDTSSMMSGPCAKNILNNVSVKDTEHCITEIITTNTTPLNDLCENAEPITGPYPLSGNGSTIEATVDCPTLLNWDGVWYTIELPYEINNLTITICGLTEDLENTGIAITDDCACDDYIAVDGLSQLVDGECLTGFNGYELTFDNVSGNINNDGLAYWPARAENSSGEKIDFTYIVDVTEGEPPPEGDSCEDPFIIPALPYSDTLNSCDFNNDLNFGGKDVVYSFSIDTCLVVTVSLCNTEPIFDTYLLIYGDSCGVMPIANDDDDCMAPGEIGTSEIIDTLHAGQYYILVDAYPDECGLFILEVTSIECEVLGACCIGPECTGTMNEAACDLLGGDWFVFEDCDQGFACPGSCYEYLPGDINMSGGNWPPGATGPDVTYLVNFFRGVSTSVPCKFDGDLGLFWASADANGDCNIIGSDVTKMVNVFRGIGSILYCGNYEPCWPTPADLPPSMPTGWPYCE